MDRLGGRYHNWEWPSWCLDKKEGLLEVYVFDEETGSGAWVPGITQTRVKKPSGRDAYLYVQYSWDGEDYAEDFAPPRVRKAGQDLTVEDMIRASGVNPVFTPNPVNLMPKQDGEQRTIVSRDRQACELRNDPALASSQAPHGHDELAEVILECIEAHGVNLKNVVPAERALAFQVNRNGTHGLHTKIGLQHQPDFFERLVVDQASLSSICPSHFELIWEAPWGAPKLRHLSQNSLLVGSTLVTFNESDLVPVPNGTCLTFCGPSESDLPFLVLQLATRAQSDVNSMGPHASVKWTEQQQMRQEMVENQASTETIAQEVGVLPRAPVEAAAAILECIRATGTNVAKLPPHAKEISLQVDKPTELGTSFPKKFFEELLKSEPKLLTYISRVHCRLKLLRCSSNFITGCCQCSRSTHQLEVENLSSNALIVAGRSLTQGQCGTIQEGGSIGFTTVSTAGQNASFLDFVLRPAPFVQEFEEL